MLLASAHTFHVQQQRFSRIQLDFIFPSGSSSSEKQQQAGGGGGAKLAKKDSGPSGGAPAEARAVAMSEMSFFKAPYSR